MTSPYRRAGRTTVCVVCGQEMAEGEEVYKNSWEQARGTHPCCGDACARAFDVDRHWIPARLPPEALQEEQGRLLRAAGTRIGERGSPVVACRELLQAGVPPLEVRGLLFRAAERRHAGRAQVDAALDDVDRWERHFTRR